MAQATHPQAGISMVSLSMKMRLCSVMGRNLAACEKAHAAIEERGEKLAEVLLPSAPAPGAHAPPTGRA